MIQQQSNPHASGLLLCQFALVRIKEFIFSPYQVILCNKLLCNFKLERC